MSMRKTVMATVLFECFIRPASTAVWSPGSDPEPPPAKDSDFARGRAAIDRKDWAGAIAAFEKVVAQDDKNANAYNWLG